MPVTFNGVGRVLERFRTAVGVLEVLILEEDFRRLKRLVAELLEIQSDVVSPGSFEIQLFGR